MQFVSFFSTMVPLTIRVALFELFFPALFQLFELNLLTNTSEPMAYSAGGFLQLKCFFIFFLFFIFFIF